MSYWLCNLSSSNPNLDRPAHPPEVYMFPGVGIVGIDDSISDLIEKLQTNEFKVQAICDKRSEKLSNISKKFSIPLVTHKIEDLMINPDINLVIFTRISANCFICKTLAVAGKHVLCLRLLAVSDKHAREMFEATLKYSVLFSGIVNPYRYSPNFLETRKLVVQKAVGKIKYVDMVLELGNPIDDVGIFEKRVIYLIDGLMYILNQPLKSVQANFEHLHVPPDHFFEQNCSDDYLNFFGKFNDGTPLSINGRIEPNSDDHYYLTVKIVGTSGVITIKNDSMEFVNLTISEYSSLSTENYVRPSGKNTPNIADCFGAMVLELKEIFSSGKYNPQLNLTDKLISFEDGIFLRAIIDAAYESSTTGSSVFISKTNDKAKGGSNDNELYNTIIQSERNPKFSKSNVNKPKE